MLLNLSYWSSALQDSAVAKNKVLSVSVSVFVFVSVSMSVSVSLCLCLCREPNPNCLAYMVALVQSSTLSRNLADIQTPKLTTESRPLTKCLSNNVGIPLLLSRPGYRFPSLYFCLSPFTLFFRNVAKPFHFWWFLPNKLQFLFLVSFKGSFIGCVPKSNLAVQCQLFS